MSGFDFDFHGLRLTALSSRALLLRDRRVLIAADLHLGRSLRSTLDGGLPLPPFDAIDTLSRLEAEIISHGVHHVILLGDSFDSEAVRELLPTPAQIILDRISSITELTLISGNHDPGADQISELYLDSVALRHIAGSGPDISGHYHPKIKIAGTSFPAFLVSGERIVLPAFGTYTGGMFWSEPVLQKIIPTGTAIAVASPPFAVPLRQCRVRAMKNGAR